MAGGEQQGEPAADAKADGADLARASVLAGQPGPYRLHVIERPPLPGAQVVSQRVQAPHRAAPGEKIGCYGQVSLTRQPVGLVTKIAAHPQGVVNDHHPGPRPLCRGGRQIGGDRPTRARDRHISHRAFLAASPLPHADVEIDGAKIAVRAGELPAEAAAFWPRIPKIEPYYVRYPKRADRLVPLLRLIPIKAGRLTQRR